MILVGGVGQTNQTILPHMDEARTESRAVWVITDFYRSITIAKKNLLVEARSL
jgi:hypothetical protein